MSIRGNTIGFPLPDPRKGMDMEGNGISNLANPLNSGDAANKQYVDYIVKSKKQSYIVTLKVGAWVDKIQKVAIEKATADITKTDILAGPDPAEENSSTYTECNVRLVEQLDGEISFSCKSVPKHDLTVNVIVFA